MTDYERDLCNYETCIHSDELKFGAIPPNPNNYDNYGYNRGAVIYEKNLILDPYLVKIYGIEYARNHPLKKID